MEDLTDTDYKHAKKACEGLKIKNVGEYHYLYVSRNAHLLLDALKNFRNMCLEIYELDPDHFLTAPD